MPDLRSVRVFVSSTFRDFAEERDELATHAWPALRALCEDRAVTFTDVDLRWGITDEQAAEGRVLPICLAEIDASRPYFIGILGERYGWVPESIPEHLIEAMPWLAEHKTKSVTELEIAHGVLNDPEMAGRAFFYFRDPAYAASVPEERRTDFVSEDAEAATRLADLKARIRASGLPLREGFSTPAELVSWVTDDLTRAIGDAYPEDETPDPLVHERLAHEAYALSRRGVWVGREGDLAALDAHASGDGPPLVVTGASGGGKSALLANWAARYRASHPDAVVIEHYCGAGADAAEWAAMCRRIAGELSAAVGMDIQLPTEATEFKNAFKEALFRFAASRRVVLLVDGVNQLADEAGAPDLAWLPPEPPLALRLVLSTLPGRALDEARRRSWVEHEVLPLTPEERTRLIADYLASFAKTLPEDLASRIAASPQAANPLFVRALLDELRVTADHERLAELIERYLVVGEINDLYELVLERYERDYARARPGLVRDAMSALWAARRGLSESELLGILGAEGAPLPRAAFSPLYLAARNSLVSKSGLQGFAHDFLRKAVEDRYLPSQEHKRAAHRVLAEWFNGDCGSRRALEELPWQLKSAGDLETLLALTARPGYLAAALSLGPAYTHRDCLVSGQIDWVLSLIPGSRWPGSLYDGLFNDDETPWYLIMGVADMLMASGKTLPALNGYRALERTARSRALDTPLGVALMNQANLLGVLGKLDEAVSQTIELEALATECEDESLKITALRVRRSLWRGDPEACEDVSQEIERRVSAVGTRESIAWELQQSSYFVSAEAALRRMREAWTLLKDAGAPQSQASCLFRWAELLAHKGEFDTAVKKCTTAVQVLEASGALSYMAFEQLAGTLWKAGDTTGALDACESAESLVRYASADVFDRVGNLLRITRLRSDILAAAGRAKDAVSAWDEYIAMARSLSADDGSPPYWDQYIASAIESRAEVLNWITFRSGPATCDDER